MSYVNINGSYMFGKKCLEQMQKNNNGHMLIIAPPLDMLYNDEWWVNHFYYSMSKFNMSLMAKYMFGKICVFIDMKHLYTCVYSENDFL